MLLINLFIVYSYYNSMIKNSLEINDYKTY